MVNITLIKVLISRLRSKKEILQAMYNKLNVGERLNKELRTYKRDVEMAEAMAEAMVRHNFKNRHNRN